MKITGMEIEKFSIELTEPFRIAFAEINSCENLLIKIETDEGYCGYGLRRLRERHLKGVRRYLVCSGRG